MKFCPYCGAKLDCDFSFCPECGKALNAADIATEPAVCAESEPVTEPAVCAGSEPVSEPAVCVESEPVTEPAACVESEPVSEPVTYNEPIQTASPAAAVNIPGSQTSLTQNKKKLGILIGAAVAVILIIAVALASCGGMSKASMQSFSFRSLTCYVPADWEYTQEDDDNITYSSPDGISSYVIMDIGLSNPKGCASDMEESNPDFSFTSYSMPCADEAYIARIYNDNGSEGYLCFFSCGGRVYAATMYYLGFDDGYALFEDLLKAIEY